MVKINLTLFVSSTEDLGCEVREREKRTNGYIMEGQV